MTEIQNPKRFGHAQRRRLRRVLVIVIWNLFVFWCLKFGILSIGA